MSASNSPEPTLRDIARQHGSDKEGSHYYADRYDLHFRSKRMEPVTLLEIGVGGYADPQAGGASLRMWKEYFPAGRIVGIDYYDKRALNEDRIAIVQGDQSDRTFLRGVAEEFGPFDFVVDDGSHMCSHVITSFGVLYPYLKDDGIYAVEDLQTSYWGIAGGSSKPNRAGTTMTFLKSLVDGLNYAEYDTPRYRPTNLDQTIQSITFYHNMVFIAKGANVEPSNFLPPHPRNKRHYRALGGWRLRQALRRRSERPGLAGQLLKRLR